MTPNRLRKIERMLADAKLTPWDWEKVEGVALALGRVRLKGSQARKEPTYRNVTFPELRLVSIPYRKGARLKRRTGDGILAQLEGDDLRKWRELVSPGEGGDDDEDC